MLRACMALLLFVGTVSGISFAQNGAAKGIPVIAVLDFEPKKVDTDLSELVSEKLSIEIVKSGKYQVVERSKMKSVIEEQKLQLAGLTGNDFAEKLGKMLAADKLVIGSVTKIGDTIYITAKLVDSQSGVIEKAESIEINSEKEIGDGVKKLSASLTGSVPGQTVEFTDDPFKFIQDTIKNNINPNVVLPGNHIEPLPSPNTNKPGYFTFDGGVFARYGLNELNFAPYSMSGTPIDLGLRVEFNLSPFFGFGLGGGTTLLLNNNNSEYSFNNWDFGFSATFNFGILKTVRFQVSCLIGFGGYSIDKVITMTNIIDMIAPTVSTGLYAVLEPILTVTFNVTSFFDFGLIYSYKWTSKVDANRFDLSHGSIGLVFIFGTDFN